MYKKQVCLFKWGYMIKDNENEAENENIYTTLVGLGLDMDTKILTIKCVSAYQYNDAYMY